uniref:ATP synthase F(0) complex subunit e, mitochondrial n=1 Tax=Podarcis muralis TaxID=64176 RepID=A0A670K3E0_PODMU
SLKSENCKVKCLCVCVFKTCPFCFILIQFILQFGRYSALLIGIVYGKKRYDYLKPIAEEERRIEAEEKKKREEMERIAKALAEASDDSILK